MCVDSNGKPGLLVISRGGAKCSGVAIIKTNNNKEKQACIEKSMKRLSFVMYSDSTLLSLVIY